MAELAFEPAAISGRAYAVARKSAVRAPLVGASAWLLAAPALALMIMMIIGPIVAVTAISLTDYQLGARAFSFIGLDNYTALLADDVFWLSLSNTLFYAAVVVPGATILGLATALLIQSGESFRALYRAVFFIPVMATLIAMAISWEFMLHPSFGLVNLFLKAIGGAPRNWLQDSTLALPVLAVVGVWQLFGFNMVLFLAGLVSIPRHLYEAAEMDGAKTAASRFWLVTWPMLGPVTFFVLVISAIRSFQVFDIVHVLTKGGPVKSTEVLLHTMYAEGFEFFRSGYAAAITVVFLLLVLVLTLVQALLLERRVHYA